MASLRTNAAGTVSVLYRHHGKQRSRTYDTEKAAEKFKALVELVGADKAIEAEAVPVQGMTVDELAEQFFDWKAKDVTDRTLADYRRDYGNWIRPTLGHRVADTVDERDVQAWVDSVLAKNLGPKKAADHHGLLSSMFKYGSAKSRRLVEHNPCGETELPRRKKAAPKSATLPEWQALHEAGARVDKDADDLMLFIVGTGWRWSEAAALQAAAVEDYYDHDGRAVMYVTVRRVFRKDAAQRQIVAEDDAKSRAGMRRTRVPDTAAQVIRRRIIGKAPGDLVFTNAAGRKWYQQNFLSRTWPRIVAASGIDRHVTPHQFRHLQVAALDRAGASLPEIQRRIGHENIQTTINVYGSGIDQISDQTLDRLDGILFGSSPVAGEVVEGAVVLELED